MQENCCLLKTLVVLLLSSIWSSNAWLLSQLGLNETYRVRHLSTHYSRVFLSITVDSNTFPTLIEAQWPQTYMPMRTQIYPRRAMHALGQHRDCARIQQSIWSQVDALNRLWVMDIGWQQDNSACPAKLLVFDLLRNNAEVLRIDCSRYIKPNDSSLAVVKLGPTTCSYCEIEKYVYFIKEHEPYILTYDVLEQTWQQRKLLSRKYLGVRETFPIMPSDMAFGIQHELVIADKDGALYTYANALFQNDTKANNDSIAKTNNSAEQSIEMELLGNLLGPSRSMLIDHLGALFYAVPRFGAIVRCEYTRNLTTEGNEIIYMTPKNIKQIFFGGDGSVWLLTDRLLNPDDHCFLHI